MSSKNLPSNEGSSLEETVTSVVNSSRRSTHIKLTDLYKLRKEFGLDQDWDSCMLYLEQQQLRKTDSFAYIVILKQCREMLHILGLIGPTTQKSLFGLNVCMGFRPDLKNLQTNYHPNTIPCTNFNTDIDTIKYNCDRSFVEQFIAICIEDLEKTNWIDNFTNLLAQYFANEEKRLQLLQDNKTLNSKLKLLSTKVDSGKTDMKKKIENTADHLAHIKDIYDNTLYGDQIQSRYINQWETAREHQHLLGLSMKEQESENNLATLQRNHDNESLIHYKIKAYSIAKEADNYNAIEHWSNKYKSDMADVLLKISKISTDKEILHEKIQRISKIYNNRQQEIDEYLVVKEKRKQEEKLYQKKCVAATKIQAWWRGTMVRHGLGPYRKKKGKKGGKANAEAKKGNKKKI